MKRRKKIPCGPSARARTKGSKGVRAWKRYAAFGSDQIITTGPRDWGRPEEYGTEGKNSSKNGLLSRYAKTRLRGGEQGRPKEKWKWKRGVAE